MDQKTSNSKANPTKSPVQAKDKPNLNPSAAPATEQATSNAATPTEEQGSQEELGRVRELLLGPDIVQQRLRGAEADRIREIIFGGQMQEYERRFTDLQREMERVLTDLRQMQEDINEFSKTQTKRMETLERETRQTDDELRREVDRLRSQDAMIQQLLTQVRQQEIMGQGVKHHADELRKTVGQQEQILRTLDTTVSEHRDQRERKSDDLKRELRQAENNLMAELRRVTDRLNDQKTDRKALASMLMEIATRLETGSNVSGLLGGLTSSAQE